MNELSDEQQLILDTVKAIARDHIKPKAALIDQKGEFPWDTVRILAEHGLLSPLLPEEYGGINLDYGTFSKIIEEIAKVCASSALILIAQADGFLPILYSGNREQKDRCLPMLSKGKLSAIAITEPNAGSDLLSMKSSARKEGTRYRLNGQKCFITNGSIADILTVYAYTDQKKNSKGISAFLLKKGTDGLSFGKNENKMGMRGSVNSVLFFDDIQVPEENLLGKEGEGFQSIMKTMNGSRLFAAAQAVGLAQGAIDEAIIYAQQRIQFGKAITSQQAIQFMIVDMVSKTESARLLTAQAAYYLDTENSLQATKFCSMAKVIASDVAMSVTTDAVQIMGGNGYSRDYPVERMMRDAKLIQIYTGTNQINRMVAAREILKSYRI
ncbi:MAG: acyl-CoA dehydrogenase [Proteobacteria bacterium]|nr:acyl-CoA dehydrogenase [Pseudomonadota bacterium]